MPNGIEVGCLKAPTALTSVLPVVDYISYRDLLFFLFQLPGRYFLVLCSGLEGYRRKYFTRQVGSRPLRFQLHAHTISNENLRAGHFFWIFSRNWRWRLEWCQTSPLWNPLLSCGGCTFHSTCQQLDVRGVFGKLRSLGCQLLTRGLPSQWQPRRWSWTDPTVPDSCWAQSARLTRPSLGPRTTCWFPGSI